MTETSEHMHMCTGLPVWKAGTTACMPAGLQKTDLRRRVPWPKDTADLPGSQATAKRPKLAKGLQHSDYWTGIHTQNGSLETEYTVHSECRGGIATAPPLRRSYSDHAVTSPGVAFQTDTNLANHRHRPKLLADCQWRWRWRCGLGRLQNTRSLTKTIPRDGRKLIKLMLRKWTFLPPHSHLIRQFIKQHLVTIRREQHVLVQWLRQ